MVIYPHSVQNLLAVLNANGFSAYLAGGCVRDALMKREPHDFDIATNALPEQVQELFKNYTVIPTGLKHGTVTVVVDGLPVEITTFRTDGKYTDNRHPTEVFFAATFKEDAMRRDFTVNAMAYAPCEGLLDYFGGKTDIDNRLIRCVGNARERFNEDSLRILRALRFASVLDFDIEAETSRAVRASADLLKNVSAERIREEFVKLICGKNAVNILMRYSDVIGVFIPEVLPMIGFEQYNSHHIYDVWEHTVKALGSIPPLPHLRLAAFFHDMGKTDTFTTDENGVGHFYGHAEQSCIKARNIMQRLKLDNNTTDRVLKIIRYHGIDIEENERSVKKYMSKLSTDGFFDVLAMNRADAMAQSEEYAYRLRHFDMLESIANEVMRKKECFSLSELAVNGIDIMELGIPQGKKIGCILDCLLTLVIDNTLPNDKAVLTEYVKNNAESF